MSRGGTTKSFLLGRHFGAQTGQAGLRLDSASIRYPPPEPLPDPIPLKIQFPRSKDVVRFPKLDRHDLPIYFMRFEITIVSGAPDFEDCVRKICLR